MLQQVDFITKRGQELSLSLGDVSSGIILTEVAGLDPVKATLVSTTFAMRDGSQHQAARRESRDIIMRASLDSRFGGATVAALRRSLYEMFMPKTEMRWVFHETDFPTVEISGIVEDVASERFGENPTFGVALRCDDPDFIDPEPKESTGEGYAGYMHLKDVEYVGSVDSGVEFEIDIAGSGLGSGFVLQQVTPTGVTRRLIFNAPLQNQDTILINTHPGQKRVSRKRGSDEVSILYGIDPQSQWPMLETGTNRIGVQVTGGTYQSYYVFNYFDRYGGL